MRLLPMSAVLGAGTLLGRVFHAVDRSHRRLALRIWRRRFRLRPPRERAAIARDMFAHFGRLLTVLLKFSTLSREQMLACVEFQGDERVVAAHALDQGVLLFTGHFGYWEINALVHALRARIRWRCWRGRSTTRCCTICSSEVRGRTGNSVIYRQWRHPQRPAGAGGEPGGGAADRSAHSDRRRGLVEFFNRPGGDDLGAGRAGAAHRRAGHSGLRAAAFRRPLSDGLRARRRAAAARRAAGAA